MGKYNPIVIKPRDLPLRRRTRLHGFSARRRLVFAVAVGVAVGIISMVAGLHVAALLLGWDASALLYSGGVWRSIHKLNPEETAEMAVLEDPTRAASDSVLITASVISLVAVGLVMADASKGTGALQLAQIALALGSVLLSWATVHIIFILRYARLYYSGRDGGISFNQKRPPCYIDFAYVAFTIGMTFQVSDTNITTTGIRKAALQQALLSYLFGAVILAATVNLVAGLSK